MRPPFLRRTRKVVTGSSESFLTTPTGATISLMVVIGGVYLLVSNMGTTSGESKFT